MVVCWMSGLMLICNDVKDRQGDTIESDVGSLSLVFHTFGPFILPYTLPVPPFSFFNLSCYFCFLSLVLHIWNGMEHIVHASHIPCLIHTPMYVSLFQPPILFFKNYYGAWKFKACFYSPCDFYRILDGVNWFWYVCLSFLKYTNFY